MLKRLRSFFYRSANNKDINYKKAIEILNKSNGILLDVRSKQEYNEGHLQSAINIDLYNLSKEIFNKIPNRQSIIIVYCTSGKRSKEAQEILESLGYTNVYNLKGGISWL